MEEEIRQKSSLTTSFTTVTRFSKYLALALFILLPFIGFYLGIQYQGNIDIQDVPPLDSSSSTSSLTGNVTQSSTSEYELTGWLGIGPRSHMLVYKGDVDNNVGEYVLKSGSDSYESVVLHTETFREGFFDYTIQSPDNTKFVIRHVSGDFATHFLIEVESSGDMVKPLQFKEFQFDDSDLAYTVVIGWIDNERIIAKTADSRTEGGIEHIEYWIAPISDLENRQILHID